MSMILPVLLATFVTLGGSISQEWKDAHFPTVLANHDFSLADRYPNPTVNTVFKDNILLTLAYTSGEQATGAKVDWNAIEQPAEYTVSLKPGETFAFHDDVLPQYQGTVIKTTNAHFDWPEGFKSDGYLVGDGVCHLASMMYWVAKDAGLDAYAPTRHDFAKIPDVPEQYGVSIYDKPFVKSQTNELQNLYITNNKPQTVTFVFRYKDNDLHIEVVE